MKNAVIARLFGGGAEWFKLLTCRWRGLETTSAEKTDVAEGLVPFRKPTFRLSEAFSSMSGGSWKLAFTLAEVLITLGIIGIVAAMTIPAVIGHYKAKVFETQLKKAYSTLQSVNMQLISREISPYNDYDTSVNGYEILDKQTKDFASLIKGAELCDSSKVKKCNRNGYYNLTNTVAVHIGPITNKMSILLSDGTIIWIGYYHWLFVDINGFKGPNRTGYDLHVFKITDRNSIVPITDPAHDTRPCTLTDLQSTDSYLGYGCTEYALVNKNPDGEGNYWNDFLRLK